MTDKNGMIEKVEGWLGSEGSREQAERVFEVMRERGLIDFDVQDGFYVSLSPSDRGWVEILKAADGITT